MVVARFFKVIAAARVRFSYYLSFLCAIGGNGRFDGKFRNFSSPRLRHCNLDGAKVSFNCSILRAPMMGAVTAG